MTVHLLTGDDESILRAAVQRPRAPTSSATATGR